MPLTVEEVSPGPGPVCTELTVSGVPLENLSTAHAEPLGLLSASADMWLEAPVLLLS